ncbi:MAG TPA: DUF302 domain-containing protein [Candidatus Krumholzibacterium sp.]|nr:DUF302 domain-containing protein [Candidatus Krumholzibacterium sp.]
MWKLFIGIVIGVVVTGAGVWMMMPGMMLKEYRSPLGFDETVEKIKENAVAEGWVVSSVTALDESVRKHGGGDLQPVMLLNLCEPHHAYNILKEDKNKVVSVMMPCTISVYRKSDGSTWVGAMNAGLLGKMFGGTVATVMGGSVAEQQQRFISFVND